MNFPKFMIRQTGGLAVGAISTRSRPVSFAFWSASAIGTIPRGSPDSPIRRTSFHRICSLTRMLFLSILHLHGQFTALLVAVVQLDAQARGTQAAGDLARRSGEPVGDEQHGRVDRSDPEGKVPGRMLDQDPQEALDGAENRAVEHDRTVLLAVLADIGQIEALAVLEVALDRPELPRASQGILHAEVDLGSIEGAVAGRHDVRAFCLLQRCRQGNLAAVPQLVRADALLGAQAQRDLNVGEPEGAVNRVHEVEEPEDLVFDLLERREDVSVVLRKRADPRQSRGDAGELIPVEAAEVGEPHRQVPVGPETRLIEEKLARAVHRLDAEFPLVDLRPVHVLVVIDVVPGELEELRVEDLRCDDLLVSARRVLRPQVVEQAVVESRAFGMEEGGRGRPGMKGEEVELRPSLRWSCSFASSILLTYSSSSFCVRNEAP